MSANQDGCEESTEVVSKYRLDFKDISDKTIVVGVEDADDEKIGGEMAEDNGVKEDWSVSDKKIDDKKSEVSGVKVASCAMIGDEVADNKKTSKNKDEVSGVKVATSANVDDDVVDDKKTSEDKAEVSGVKVAMYANVGDEVVDNEKTSEESGIKMVSRIASSESVDNYFL